MINKIRNHLFGNFMFLGFDLRKKKKLRVVKIDKKKVLGRV